MNYPGLKDQIVESFNLSELQTLCFDLGIKFENLPGETLEDKAREIVDYCRRLDCTSELITYCQKKRPKIDWAEIASVADDTSLAIWGGGNYMAVSQLPEERILQRAYVIFDDGAESKPPGLVILTTDRLLLLPLKWDVADTPGAIGSISLAYDEIRTVQLPRGKWSILAKPEKRSPWFVVAPNEGNLIHFSLSTTTIPGVGFSEGIAAKIAGLISEYTGWSLLARDLEFQRLVKPSEQIG